MTEHATHDDVLAEAEAAGTSVKIYGDGGILVSRGGNNRYILVEEIDALCDTDGGVTIR